MSARTQIWSSGGGTQSCAIAAMIVLGELEKPDLAIIVDTERECSTTWEYHDCYVAPALANVGEMQDVAERDHRRIERIAAGDPGGRHRRGRMQRPASPRRSRADPRLPGCAV